MCDHPTTYQESTPSPNVDQVVCYECGEIVRLVNREIKDVNERRTED